MYEKYYPRNFNIVKDVYEMKSSGTIHVWVYTPKREYLHKAYKGITKDEAIRRACIENFDR